MRYNLEDIASIVGGELRGANNVAQSIVFDSRVVIDADGALFVALKGDIFDGHNYINQLLDRGVKSFIVSRDFVPTSKADVGYVVVESPIKALQRLAAYHRTKLRGTVVAITGSNGKSVVKEWIYQLLCDTFKIFRSPKSYNSQLGVPLSILMADYDDELVVIEAGISQKGEMQRLEAIIKPDIVLVTNIGEAHGCNFSSIDEKLNEKLKLINSKSRVVYCVDDRFIGIHIEDIVKRENCFGWGLNGDLKIIASNDGSILTVRDKDKEYVFNLPMNDVATRQNISHIIALASLIGVDLSVIVSKMKSLSKVEMRLEIKNGIGDMKIINDAYNSDYNSLVIALGYMKSIAKGHRKIVILSDISQSGRDEQMLYRDVAQQLVNSEIDIVIAIGSVCGKILKKYYKGKLDVYTNTDTYLKHLRPLDYSGAVVLLKGERSFGFERISAQLEEKQHATIMEVNLSALSHNYRYFRSKLAQGVRMVAMVKALSYGSGAYEVADTLQDNGIDYLAVAYIDEGVTLRLKDIVVPIIILNSNPADYDSMIAHHLEPEIYNIRSLKLFIERCEVAGVKRYPIHIKIDTGMHRMGFEQDDIRELLDTLNSTNAVKVVSVFSHFSSSDDCELDCETERQISNFTLMSEPFVKMGAIRHICNTHGILRFPKAHFDMVRLGIGLYGISGVDQDKLENVNSLYTHILQIRDVKKGEYVGYNMKGKAERDMRVATLAIGYADGLNRGLSCGRWNMTINGQKAPIIGNISMDTCGIDITGIDAKEGDIVTVFSSNEDICNMATVIGTIPYEVLTSISTRIKRVYVRD